MCLLALLRHIYSGAWWTDRPQQVQAPQSHQLPSDEQRTRGQELLSHEPLPPPSPAPDGAKIVCVPCQRTFQKWSELQQHLDDAGVHRPRYVPVMQPAMQPAKRPPTRPAVRPAVRPAARPTMRKRARDEFKCVPCERVFVDEIALLQHNIAKGHPEGYHEGGGYHEHNPRAIHHSGEASYSQPVFTCTGCGAIFSTKATLMAHHNSDHAPESEQGEHQLAVPHGPSSESSKKGSSTDDGPQASSLAPVSDNELSVNQDSITPAQTEMETSVNWW